jgi:hypothetical protein
MSRFLAKLAFGFSSVLFISIMAGNAFADGIVLVGSDPCFPAGVGRGCGSDRSPHILTIQGHPSASGAVSYSASGDIRSGDWQRGSNTRTMTLAEAGITNANSLRLYFDINEPNGQNRTPVTVMSLVLTAYNDAGQSVFSSSLVNGPLELDQLGSGQGRSDYVFILDAAAAARLAAVFSSGLHIGLSATITNTQGGPESFFLGNGGVSALPEPATMSLFGVGLAGLVGAVLRRRTL